MSISSIGSSSYASEAISNKLDPAQVKKASEKNHDAKQATQSVTSTPAVSVPSFSATSSSANSSSTSSAAAALSPTVNTSGETVGKFVSVKA